MSRRRGVAPFVVHGLVLVGAVVLWLAWPRPVQAQVLYGYEDSLGMLHTSKTKVNEHYKLLVTGKIDNEGLYRAVREQNAIGGPPPKRPAAILPADLGSLSEAGERIIQAAEPFMRAPYRLGGDTAAGIDCSGLTKAVYSRFGCDLPRQSRLQAERGTPVGPTELAAGDLLFFSTNREVGINHVGIYLGSGRMLHSSSRRGGVAVDRLAGTEYEHWFVTARRLAQTGRDVAAATGRGK
jgi:cell wall-associated NlpC family hydrolase